MASCEYFELLLSRSLDGDLSPREQAELRDHLAGCPECRRLSAQLAQIHRAFSEWENRPVPEGFAQGVMDRVRAHNPGARKAASSRRRSYFRVLASLAACALICAGLWNISLPDPVKDAPRMLAAGDEPAADLALPEGQVYGSADTAGEEIADSSPYARQSDGLPPTPCQSVSPSCASILPIPDSSQLLESAAGALGTVPGTLFVLDYLPDGLAPEGTWITTQEGWLLLELAEPVPDTVCQQLADSARLTLSQGDGSTALLLLN